jgi:hypothetical protein
MFWRGGSGAVVQAEINKTAESVFSTVFGKILAIQLLSTAYVLSPATRNG